MEKNALNNLSDLARQHTEDIGKLRDAIARMANPPLAMNTAGDGAKQEIKEISPRSLGASVKINLMEAARRHSHTADDLTSLAAELGELSAPAARAFLDMIFNQRRD